ncbi:aldo/keto reductase [Limoniibacter endophyticus]|uniref:Oxidoreductase n=1 Tax=Limoniibacter endophyticus TaxID=1565040 RepID=A0A8J3DGA7_9HYPH|nr:aldo/keto reductase [Limoniibacter endophyticus]GHC64048.1 oxidoreductase [Limoniibacter endophyticus]
MQYKKLGSTGLDISALCLGCMTYGVPERGNHEWTLDEEKSRPLIIEALEAGINFLDTANMYSDGTSEEIVGKVLKEVARRDEIVLATKVYMRMHEGPNGQGLSRKAILSEIDNSLRRLGTDYVDLYQIHRWDYGTPVEETMEALHDVVKAGKARYIGASSMFAWQFAKAQHVAERHGWTKFISMQNHVSLLYREEEREMIPLCIDQGVGIIPWSPLARGKLARAWEEEDTVRNKTDKVIASMYDATKDADKAVVDAVGAVAAARNVPRAQVALAWVIQKKGISAPIVGASKPGQLDDALAAVELKLTDDEIAALEAPYVPHAVVGIN